MALTKKEFSNYIKQFNFRELFNDMGWNNDKINQPIAVENVTLNLQSVAVKSGFKILLCHPQADGLIPDYSTRKKIETKITKLFQEHLIIFFDTDKTEQIWQLVVRQSGKPTKVTETRWHIKQDPELLFQRAAGIFFELDEEDKITIIDVKNRVGENFHQNNEKITKVFYEKFKKEHSSFLHFIKGIADKGNQEWYASLMLNRLMFCYFIQKKGFLDNNNNYLRDKLLACKEKKGDVKFYSFYRDFLLVLFHQGLNEPTQNPDVKIEIGKIPYLNGGLFDEHELEKAHAAIQIDDKAFEHLFDFFDQYEWHLDTSITATGRDINPDVIGYIFEKYINDRANMGAYYTKEDITDYISKNCILPYLFDETRRNYPKGFNAGGELWQMVNTSGDHYVYDAIKKGVKLALPNEIEQGIKEVSKRTEWNKPATSTYALPTEIWRETVDRRSRYAEVKNKIDTGEVKKINDFITYNLNVRQFAQDVIENTNDPDFLKHFYKALNRVTIIDPTCGSGAFLFAAMNILEPLYESCIQRMRAFTEDEDRRNGDDKEKFKNKYSYFRTVLESIQSPQHPNLQYFIYKSIILRNLYGVDIMKEAVEIAKLRLFLKLVATVEADYRKPNLGLEPLPDIDFNIRAGNTLVGFATEIELKHALDYTFDGPALKQELLEKCDIVRMAFERYKEIQLSGEIHNYEDFKEAKDNLDIRLKDLNHSANILLSRPNGANLTKEEEILRATLIKAKKGYSSEYINPNSKYADFLRSHKPFHWFAEFYEIVNNNGGFDVVIGNPPYVEYSKVRDTYKLKDYDTEKCGNLYGYLIERSYKILGKNGLIGMIIPISAFSNSSMESLQKFFKKFPLTYISNFHQRPAALFEGVLQRLSIFICYKENQLKGNYSTIVYRWKVQTRSILFSSLSYVECDQSKQNNSLKIGHKIELSILNKFLKHSPISSMVSKNAITGNGIYYRTAGGGYWVTILNTPFATTSLSNKRACFRKEFNSKVISGVLNSNLFWWYYTINFDQFNFKDYMMFGFKFNYPADISILHKLMDLSDILEKELMKNATSYTINSKTRGSNETITYNKYFSKKTMDDIDIILAKHYGFSQEELNFIMNYDIKYRMSKEAESEE